MIYTPEKLEVLAEKLADSPEGYSRLWRAEAAATLRSIAAQLRAAEDGSFLKYREPNGDVYTSGWNACVGTYLAASKADPVAIMYVDSKGYISFDRMDGAQYLAKGYHDLYLHPSSTRIED